MNKQKWKVYVFSESCQIVTAVHLLKKLKVCVHSSGYFLNSRVEPFLIFGCLVQMECFDDSQTPKTGLGGTWLAYGFKNLNS